MEMGLLAAAASTITLWNCATSWRRIQAVQPTSEQCFVWGISSPSKVFERMQLLEGALEYFGTVLNTFKTEPVFPFGFTATRVERTLVSSSICSWEISYP